MAISAWALATAPAAAANWTVESVVSPTVRSGELSGVACWSNNGCIAVGSATSRSGTQVAVAEDWNGKRWTRQRVPAPADIDASALDGVACISRRDCIAVGVVTDSTGQNQLALTERWDGRHWSVLRNRGRGQLNGVSCTSASACEAVGEEVIERWNGKRWTVVHKLRPEQSLAGVSCASARACIAVGEWNQANFAERYDGRTWKRQLIPTPGGEEDFLTSVSCLSARACIAAGATIVDSNGDAEMVTERWNGSRWSIQDPADNAVSETVNDLSCTSLSACVAVGTFTTSLGTNHPFVEQWNGHRWAVRFTARPRGAQAGAFAGVSCVARRECEAVGSSTTRRLESIPLAERFDAARWRVKPTAGFVGAASATLDGVSCVAAATCTAVGEFTNSAGHQLTLAERDTGGRWKIQPTPEPTGAAGSGLLAVSCTSSASCVAVGVYCRSLREGCGTGIEGDRPAAEISHASKWAVVPAPIPPGSSSSQLSSVSCAAPTSCIAVGERQAKGGTTLITPLIEAWNGSAWTIVDAPTPSGSSNTQLSGVSCSSKTACTAVGSFNGVSTNGFTEPFAEVWNGSTWAFQTPAVDGGVTAYGGQLNAVSCVAPESCVAVGTAQSSAGGSLIEASAGSDWATTIPPGAQASLAGVSCSGKDNCVAVGKNTEESNAMLAFGWDGTASTVQDVPPPNGATSGQFNAVSCPSGAPCVGVGSFTTTVSQSQPVVEDHP